MLLSAPAAWMFGMVGVVVEAHGIDTEELNQCLYVSVWFCFLPFSTLWHAPHEGTLSDTQEPSPTVKIQEMVCMNYILLVFLCSMKFSHIAYCFVTLPQNCKQFELAKSLVIFCASESEHEIKCVHYLVLFVPEKFHLKLYENKYQGLLVFFGRAASVLRWQMDPCFKI